MNTKDFSSHDLEDYVSKFNDEVQRENVLKQILEADILEKVFETTEGKVVLNSCVDMIRDNTMKIVSVCINDKPIEDKWEAVELMSMEIKVIEIMMRKWATMLMKGKAHKGSIKKNKQ